MESPGDVPKSGFKSETIRIDDFHGYPGGLQFMDQVRALKPRSRCSIVKFNLALREQGQSVVGGPSGKGQHADQRPARRVERDDEFDGRLAHPFDPASPCRSAS